MAKLIERIREALRRGHRFVTYGVWQIGKPGEDIPRSFVIKQVRVAILLGSKLLDGMHMVRASALAFATLLSIVPFLAVTFYVIETFNLGEDLYAWVQERLETVVEQASDVITPGDEDPDAELPETVVADAVQEDSATEIEAEEAAPPSDEEPGQERGPPVTDEGAETAVAATDVAADVENSKSRELQEEIVRSLFQGVTSDREGMRDPAQEIVDMVATLAHDAATNSAALTISGFLLVITTVFGLMRNVENTFNRIWGVRRRRSWYRMFSDYIVITLLLPFMTAAVLGITAALQSETISDALGPLAFGLRFSQHVLIVLVFTLLYKLVPSTHVRFRYALLAGIVAGTLWVLLSMSYIQFQVGLARYAVMLSAFAQFPMLMTWIYLSWAILLLGCEVAYAYQNESTFALERFAPGASYAYREAVGVRAMVEIGRHFIDGMPRLTIETMATSWNVPVRLLRDALESLEEAGYVASCATDPVSYQPGRPLDQMHAGDIVRVLREDGEEPSRFLEDETFKSIFDELGRCEDDFGGATIADLIEGVKSAEAAREPSQTLNG